MEKYYHFAGIDLAIEIPDDRMYTDERSLAPFSVESVSDPERFQFELVDQLTPPVGDCQVYVPGLRIYQDGVRYFGAVESSWETAYIRIAPCGKFHHVQLRASEFRDRVGVHTVLNAMGVEHLVARAGGILFHCSYIQHGGKAILFTAPSGTGKSTQADLWQKYRGTDIINGDRAVIRVVDGQVMAEGLPFAGSSVHCKNRSLPLEAIVYLNQAPVTSIRRMRGYEAFARIWEGISVNTWDKRDMELVSEAVQHVAASIPVYHLPCTPDESAVIALERILESR